MEKSHKTHELLSMNPNGSDDEIGENGGGDSDSIFDENCGRDGDSVFDEHGYGEYRGGGIFRPNRKRKSTASVVFCEIVIENQIDFEDPPSRDYISCINVLWLMTFFGFAMESMHRFNISVAIIDMIQLVKHVRNQTEGVIPECYQATHEASIMSGLDANGTLLMMDERQRFSFERLAVRSMNMTYNENGFDWDEYQQGLILGSLYWTYGLTQIPGGMLARKYGTKIVFGQSILITSLLCFLIPIFSYIDIRMVIAVRIIQGLFLGFTWPAMHHMVGQWIPPNRRSRFFTSYMGNSIGIAVGSPIFGYVTAWLSWEWIFHLLAVVGILWYIAWYFLIFDTPAQHPRIDIEEREYIEFALKDNLKTEVDIPWRQILTSGVIWVNVFFHIGCAWGMLTLGNQTPTYFKNIFGLDIEKAGILSGLPHFSKIIFSYFVSKYADHLLKSDTMSRRNVRVCAGLVTNVLFGIFIIGLAFSGCHYVWAVIFLILGHTSNGALSASALANVVDLSPNFSGVLMGLMRMISVAPGFVSSYIVGELTLNNQTSEQWKYVFLITGGILIGTGLLYALLTDADVQDWNNYQNKKRRKSLEISRRSELK